MAANKYIYTERLNTKLKLSTLVEILIFPLIILSSLSSFLNFKFNLNIFYIDDSILIILSFFLLISCRIFRSTIASTAILIFILINIISALINETSIESMFLQIRSYMLPAITYFSINHFVTNKYFDKKIFKLIFGFSFILTSIGLFEFITSQNIFNNENRFGNLYSGHFRIQSLIGHPADYGYYIVLSIIILFFFIQNNTQRKNKTALYILLTMSILNLVLTLSRGPLAIFAGTTIIFSVLFLKIQKTRNTICILLIPILLIISSISIQSLRDRISIFFSNDLVTLQQGIGYEASRADFYLQAKDVFLDNIIIGVGPGQFGGWVATSSDSLAHQKYYIDTYGISSIDVFYPHLAGELGIIGLTSYFLIFFTIIYKFNRRLKIAFIFNRKDLIIHLQTAIMSSIFIFLCGFLSMINETFPHMIMYWTIIGITETKTNCLKM